MENLTDLEREILNEALFLYIGDKNQIRWSTQQALDDDEMVRNGKDWQEITAANQKAKKLILVARKLGEKFGIGLN